MAITAKIVADSISPEGKRLTTFVLEYPRFIHAEFMTHRLFSRNASSSRAIPVRKQIERIIRDPAVPVHWGSNRPGMQATEELKGWRLWVARRLWLFARWPATFVAYLSMWVGLHKQVANRILEPWMHISVVCTATEWGNWFNLRYHPAAQPEIQALAKAMWRAMEVSKPRALQNDQWHLPFVDEVDRMSFDLRGWDDQNAIQTLLKVSAARCARVSYLNHEGRAPTLEEDLKLFQRLMGGNPKHASPTEHQARPMNTFRDLDLGGNFQGWVQFRKTIEGEYMPDFPGPEKE